ncbi:MULTISPECIES: poly(3-hydroxybutyrate) depolymerase [Rhodomicrobium]|uniref:extracellular catalytic domain type 2 short-chain-length polyhydroxyalkanoate depolymerase n=1 Tax=Rhodomicrobium TaxID=1068 RepID=UPI001FDA4B37|nr:MULTISPECIES: poly(3-hydroxybutyrate) depolymerase [Rhodomicrobium]
MAAPARRGTFRAAALFVFSLLSLRPSLAEPLPGVSADLMRTSVSGLSSGAYMAGQFQVAYSQIVIGAGLVAGGPYGCADTPGTELNPFWLVVLSWNLARAENKCMEDGWFFSTVPDPKDLLARAKRLEEEGRIDPLKSLAQDKLYLFSSRKDDTIESGVVEAAAEFYRRAGIQAANTDFVIHDKAAHAFLTESQGLACGTTGTPFINDCDYDQAGAILERLMGPLKPAGEAVEAHFQRFEQRPFLDRLPDADFDDEGLVYIPAECRTQGGCAVHIVFHGCKQGLAAIGEQFVKGSGYARWAETNRIILLFPQVKPGPLNPNGCWDWWGFTGREFLERQAPQMRGVRRMLERLTEAPSP